MAIEVEAPDGSIVEYPDDTPLQTIRDTMQRAFAKMGDSSFSQTAETAPAGPGMFDRRSDFIRQFIGSMTAQDWADLGLQSVGTALGVGIGSIGGPPGMLASGALGNVGGKLVARSHPGAEQPGLGELAIDAAIGSAGPAASALAKGGARMITGVDRAVRRQASEAITTTPITAWLIYHRAL